MFSAARQVLVPVVHTGSSIMTLPAYTREPVGRPEDGSIQAIACLARMKVSQWRILVATLLDNPVEAQYRLRALDSAVLRSTGLPGDCIMDSRCAEQGSILIAYTHSFPLTESGHCFGMLSDSPCTELEDKYLRGSYKLPSFNEHL